MFTSSELWKSYFHRGQFTVHFDIFLAVELQITQGEGHLDCLIEVKLKTQQIEQDEAYASEEDESGPLHALLQLFTDDKELSEETLN